MAAEANRLAHFRAKVLEFSPVGKDGQPRLKEGYSAVATDTGLSYDYVYQVYNGKSGKKGLGQEAVRKFSEAYGEGRPANWMDLPIASIDDEVADQEFEPVRPPTLEESVGQLAEVLTSLDPLGRELASQLLAALAKNPEETPKLLPTLVGIVERHAQVPQEPQPPITPKPTRKASKAAEARPRTKAALVLKIGGGQKQQFSLPLVRSAFKTSSASANERAWYERLKAVPKADQG
jgi:hypothetical protein